MKSQEINMKQTTPKHTIIKTGEKKIIKNMIKAIRKEKTPSCREINKQITDP